MENAGHRVGRLDSVTIDCHDPDRLAVFWASIFGTAEEWRGGDRRRSVSTPRSSNPAGGFPAPGSRTRTHTFAHGKLFVRALRRSSPNSSFRY